MLKQMVAPILFLALAVPALALDADEVTLPNSMQAAEQTVVLNGTGLRVAYGLVDVYVAGLYLAEKTSDADAALAMDGAKYMSMTFVRDVDGEDICEAWIDGVEDNVAEAGVPALTVRLERLCSATPDIVEGDVMTYEYDPGKENTTFAVNGAVKVVIPGKDFFHALLACWIGPDPGPGDDFKEDLLGLE
jgi:hypothetical protein